MTGLPAPDDNLLARVREVASRVLHGHSVRLFLFGSHATGRTHRLSDVDLAVEATEPLPAGLLARLREAFEESDIPLRVDVVNLDETDETLRARIRAEGVEWNV